MHKIQLTIRYDYGESDSFVINEAQLMLIKNGTLSNVSTTLEFLNSIIFMDKVCSIHWYTLEE